MFIIKESFKLNYITNNIVNIFICKNPAPNNEKKKKRKIIMKR